MPQTIFPKLIFGRLTVIEYSHYELGGPCPTRKRWKRHYWKCVCACGKEVVVGANGLRSGDIQSCGCLRLERTRQVNTKHGACRGYKKTKEWRVWNGMLRRCYDRKTRSYIKYGAAGVLVCGRWHDYQSFIDDMGLIPEGKYSIDRINNSFGYTCGCCEECKVNNWPSNCRWADRFQQASNRKTSRIIEYNGKRQWIEAWSRDLGISSGTIRARMDIYHWPINKALEKQILGKKNVSV